ncbi:hypothetical protein OSTOST_10188, partial [Ostertagia ostertagi]
TRDAKFQQKAIKKAEEIGQGEKILAPKYPTEEKRFKKAQADEKVKELVNKMDPTLIENVNKINIKSTEPAERWTSTKDLPTHESEWMHRNDPVWEYGFYEPEEDKIPKNKLMFREALEVVPKRELAQLQEYLQGRSDETTLLGGTRDGVRKLIQRNKDALEHYDKLEKPEQKQLEEAIIEQRKMEKERLATRLKDIEFMEEQSKKLLEEAKKKAAEAKEIK